MGLEKFFNLSAGDKEEDSKLSPRFREWVAKHKDKCFNCGKSFTSKNPEFWSGHLWKITKTKAFFDICTRCACRQLTDTYNRDYYGKRHPNYLKLCNQLGYESGKKAKRLKKGKKRKKKELIEK